MSTEFKEKHNDPFLRNYWYVGALSEEVKKAEIFSRVLLNKPVIFYRKEDGTVVALENRCCHKHYPLHKGTLESDNIRCGYHGFLFNDEGRCIEVPNQDIIPSNCSIKKYPCIERNNWVWIWMGDPELADPDDITDYHWLDDKNWGAKTTVFHVKANYRLIIENLLDLTHLTYVHKTTIGNSAVTLEAETKYERGENEVKITRWMMDVQPPPAYIACGCHQGNIDRWMIVHYAPPAFCRLYTGGTPAGTGAREGKRINEMGWRNLNAITPESESTTHYFWGQAHNNEPGNHELTEKVFNGVSTAFKEDWEVFEEQQWSREMGAANIREIVAEADTGNVHAIRILDRLLEKQAAGESAMVRPRDLKWGPFD